MCCKILLAARHRTAEQSFSGMLSATEKSRSRLQSPALPNSHMDYEKQTKKDKSRSLKAARHRAALPGGTLRTLQMLRVKPEEARVTEEMEAERGVSS